MSSLLFSRVHCCVFSLDVAFGCDCVARYLICQKPLTLALVGSVDLFRDEQTILTTDLGSCGTKWVGLGSALCRQAFLPAGYCCCCCCCYTVSAASWAYLCRPKGYCRISVSCLDL